MTHPVSSIGLGKDDNPRQNGNETDEAEFAGTVAIGNQPMTARWILENTYLPRKRSLSPKTISKMGHDISRWERLTGNPPVEILNEETFETARKKGLEAGLSNDTIETTVGSVITLLRFAKRKKLISEVPDEGEKLPRSRRRRHVPSVYDLSQCYRFAYVARWPKLNFSIGEFWKAWFVCSYFTGLRLQDQMTGLFWKNLSDEALFVEASKTGKFHVFPVNDLLRRHLEPLRRIGDERIFPVTKSPHLVRRELARISEKAGLKVKMGPQAMRRLAGTQWQKAKWGAGQTLLGHTLGVSNA